MITSHGDPAMSQPLPATVPADRVALVCLHDRVEDSYAHVGEWGITAFGPDSPRASSRPLLDWLAATGCSRVAVHLDIDAVNANEGPLGFGKVPGGFTGAQVNRIVHEINGAYGVASTTIAEFFPRDVVHVQQVLHGFPLIGG
ncbi:hypothetical protein ACIQB5_24665 [Streptomyces sp. NPDC088560]|uniref:hypothetical protein n=1 Tax=Streptomyces sp. NPDC088560 TaxID=3365868 RepID=UPI0038304EE1